MCSHLARACSLLIAILSLAAGLSLAVVHPIAPISVSVAFIAALSLFSWRPAIGLFSLPLLLPLLDFSPWTGWLIVDEFDLLVLAVIAAGYLRMRDAGQLLKPVIPFLLIAGFIVLRGASAVDLHDVDWFAGYTSAMNGIRVGKSFLWLALLVPLLMREYHSAGAERALARFFVACLLGGAGVVVSVFWERAFYPGLLDMSTPYRAVGLFWEMHFGGAALDTYLVLLAPLLVWAWRKTVSAVGRALFGVFVLAFAYVCLTTFSRGAIAVIACSVTVLGIALAWRRWKDGQGRRRIDASAIVVLVMLALEIAVVFGSDSFMSIRVAESGRDLSSRWRHWAQGIDLLTTPTDWVFGIGPGRLPARLTQGETGLPLSGEHAPRVLNGRTVMTITGPLGAGHQLSGLYQLSQRVDLAVGGQYLLAIDAFSQENAKMRVQLCAQYLLYPASCEERTMRLRAGGWRHEEWVVSSPQFNAFWTIGPGVLKVSVLTPGARVDLASVSMYAGVGNLLRNGQFREGSAGWYPMASTYFVPWHIDNLYLEILIESGLIGLLLFLSLVCVIAARLVFTRAGRGEFAPYLLASLGATLSVGLVISVVDMPRILILLGVMTAWSWIVGRDAMPGTAH